jgi:hypothetical protein
MPVIDDLHFKNLVLQPSNDSCTIWRYMAIDKFRDLLNTQKLYFSSIQKNREQDKMEGTYPDIGRQLPNEFYPLLEDHLGWRHAINCWSIQETESQQLWDTYIKKQGGVAIKTTIANLKSSLDKSQEEIRLGLVRYQNYGVQSIKAGYAFTPLFTKGIDYNFEKELRLIVTLPHHNTGFCKNGIALNCDIGILIEKIYITSSDYKEAVESIVKQYGLDQLVCLSKITL